MIRKSIRVGFIGKMLIAARQKVATQNVKGRFSETPYRPGITIDADQTRDVVSFSFENIYSCLISHFNGNFLAQSQLEYLIQKFAYVDFKFCKVESEYAGIWAGKSRSNNIGLEKMNIYAIKVLIKQKTSFRGKKRARRCGRP